VSTVEVAVTIIGALLGYWAVSSLTSKTPTQAPRPNSDGNFESAGGAGTEPPEGATLNSGYPASNCFAKLGILESASVEEIKTAYRVLVAQYHPDKVASLGPELRELAERKTVEINTAYTQALAHRGVQS